MKILGINSCFTANHHDPSVVLIVDGKIIAAIEEERLNRIKTSIGLFPSRSINFCLKYAGISIHDIDIIAAPGITAPDLVEKIQSCLVHDYNYSPPVKLWPHYECHGAGAFYSSSFSEALVVSVDGYGDKVSSWVAKADSAGLHEVDRYEGLNSIGNFYAQFTEHLGFIRTEGEFKVMGMAAYGEAKYDLKSFIKFEEGRYISNSGIIVPAHKVTSTFEPSVNHRLLEQKGYPKRDSVSGEFLQKHYDLASSVQAGFEEAYIGLISSYRDVSKNLCLSGGSALNCLANGKLLSLFDNIYVMPAASDRGLSMGAAFLQAVNCGDLPIAPEDMFLGGEFSDELIREALEIAAVEYEYEADSVAQAAKDIANGKIIGWFKGRSEFGPRALGARSILASPSIKGTKAKINKKIKFREEYRPFAPAVLESAARRCGVDKSLPYMTIAIKPNEALASHISETIHADGTARLQTVSDSGHPLSQLLKALQDIGEFPAVINTSFNINGEPIVETPLDAVRTFYSCGLDSLYIENFVLRKRKR